jgi:peptidoglycan/LPS O-acetylase OafA/YrhL
LTVAAIGQNQILTKNYVYHLLLVHNLRDHFFFGLIGVFWTLAVEVQLYAMYPIALLLRRRWGTTGALGTSLLIAIVFWVIAGSLMDWSGPLGFVRVNNPLTLWPAWLIGAWLIERHRYGRSGFMRPVVVGICATIALFTASLFKPTFAIATFTLAAIASAALVDRVMATPRQSGRFVSGLAVAGACSYSLYMLHQPLFIWLVKAIGPVPPLEMMLIGLPISLIFAVAVASRPARIQVTVV